MGARSRTPHDLRGEDTFVLAREVRDVGGGAAHVEADDPVEAGELRHAGHADDAAGRAGQDGVLAAELPRFGQASVGLHEHQPHAVEFTGDTLDVAAQHRREVGVDDRGVSARDELHQRTDLTGERDLREAGAGGQFPDGLFVGRVEVAVHADHGDGPDSVVIGLLKGTCEGVQVGGAQDGSVGGDPFVDLEDPLVQQLGEIDAAGEDVGAVLIGDAQGVAEAAGDDQQGPFALAFQEGVGGDGRPHADRLDGLLGAVQQMADTGDRRVGVPRRIVRQQFVCEQTAVRSTRDDVGESAASVDPELPARRHIRLPDRTARHRVHSLVGGLLRMVVDDGSDHNGRAVSAPAVHLVAGALSGACPRPWLEDASVHITR